MLGQCQNKKNNNPATMTTAQQVTTKPTGNRQKIKKKIVSLKL